MPKSYNFSIDEKVNVGKRQLMRVFFGILKEINHLVVIWLNN
jgi:hypothetical protein